MIWNFLSEVHSGNPLVDWLAQAGAVGVMALGCVAFLRGWIVPGSAAREEIRQLREERDRALELVYKQAELTQKAIELSSGKVK